MRPFSVFVPVPSIIVFTGVGRTVSSRLKKGNRGLERQYRPRSGFKITIDYRKCLFDLHRFISLLKQNSPVKLWLWGTLIFSLFVFKIECSKKILFHKELPTIFFQIPLSVCEDFNYMCKNTHVISIYFFDLKWTICKRSYLSLTSLSSFCLRINISFEFFSNEYHHRRVSKVRNWWLKINCVFCQFHNGHWQVCTVIISSSSSSVSKQFISSRRLPLDAELY